MTTSKDKTKNKVDLTEAFEQLWEEHHDPRIRRRKKFLRKRKKRAKFIKQDLGLL